MYGEEMDMYKDQARMVDAFVAALEMAKSITDPCGLRGYGVVALMKADGRLEVEPFANVITTVGDEYYARRGAAGIGTPNIAQPTLVGGMKVGTGATAASKSGAGAVLTTYATGSNRSFDTTHPALVDETGDTGWSIEYKVTWPSGGGSLAANVTEAAVVTDPADNTNSTSTEVISRVTFTAKNKTVDDTLAITWKHTMLG